MIKKIIVTTLLGFSLSTAAFASQGHGKHDGLVELPHLMKILLEAEDINIDKKQQEKLDAILEEIPVIMHAMMDDAKDLERKIKREIMHNKKTLKDVTDDLAHLQTIEYNITKVQIQAINKIQNILSHEQYKKLIKTMMKNKAKNKKSC